MTGMSCIVCGSDRETKKFRYSAANFYECSECGLVRTLPFPTPDMIREHYRVKLETGNYRALLSNMEMYTDIYKGYIELLKARISPLQDKKILDVGCFTGDFLDLAQKEGAITWGIELQQEAFVIANRKHPGRILNCNFDEAVFKEKFDVVTLFGVIEHLTNPEVLLEKTAGWMTGNGLVIIQTPNTGSVFAKLLNKYWPPFAPVEHIHYFSERNIVMLLNKFNFTDIIIKPHVKKLSIEYVYSMLRNFGPEFQTLLTPFFTIMPASIRSSKMNFYAGEMLVSARKTG